MWAGLLIDRINNKLKKSNLINEHALEREPGLAMPFFIFGDSRLFYCVAAFILIGRILLWLHSLLLQFNKTDVCLLSMTVCICWHWLYFFLCALVNILSVQFYSTALIWVCPQCTLLFFYQALMSFFGHMVRHLVFGEVRLFVNIMFAWLSYIRDHITDC